MHTTFNVKQRNELHLKGYHWDPKLQLSIQNKDSKATMREIMHMIRLNNYSIQISIKLKIGEIVNYKYNM
jgi:hypothetical protein